MNRDIRWIDNLKIIGLLCIMTFHFWPAMHPAIRDFSVYAGDWAILKLPLRNGFQGTFLFIIASGIGLALLVQNRKPSWFEFYRTRFLRIYIPYWIALAVVLAFYASGSNVSVTPAKNALLWVANILLFEVPVIDKVQPHFWFLFVLVRLYLFFPLLYIFIKRTGIYGLSGVMAFQIAAYTAYNFYPTPILQSMLGQVIAWLFPFSLGIYVGLRLAAERETTEGVLHRLFPLGLIIFFAGTVANNYAQANPVTFILVSIGILLVGFKIASLNWHLPRISNISYEIYLLHLTVLAIASPILKPVSIAVLYLGFLSGSLVAGYLLSWMSKAAYGFINALNLRRERLLRRAAESTSGN